MKTVVVRILPHQESDIRPDPRVVVLRTDAAGFTIVRAELEEDEGVCWRCGSIANDPGRKLQVCPVCSGDFND